MKPITVDNFRGGWNANEPTTIEDNQLSEAINFFYNETGLPQSRAGTAAFSDPLPDDAIVIHNCDTFNGNGTWAGTEDAVSVATDASNHYRGAGAVSFMIDVSNDAANSAILTNPNFTGVDLSSAADTGTVRLILKINGAVTNITGVRLRWGSASTDYYESTVTTQINSVALVNGKNILSFDWATATTTGTPNDAAIDYLQLQIQYGVAQTDITGCLLDSICWYSATSTKPSLRHKAYKESSGTVQYVVHCGDNLFAYNETQDCFDLLLTGLAETRGQFAVYKDISYYVNGTDYVSFDGKLCEQEATPVKVKYLIVVNDVAFGAGATADPSTLYYSNGNPSSLKIAFANTDPIDEDNGETIKGLGNIGNFIYVLKENSAYKFDTSGPAYAQIDKNIGTLAFGSIVKVDNNLLFQGQDGHIYNAYVEEAGSTRTKADALSFQLDPYIDGLSSKSLTAAFEYKALNNVYFAVDADGSGAPTEVLVLSTRQSALENNVGVFTRYVGINANDFTLWEDSDGVEHLLVANAFGGQILEMETGVNDDGSEIQIDLQTKAYELGEGTVTKFVKNIDGIFHATDGATFDFEAVGDDTSTTIGGATITVDEASSQSSSIGVNPVGTVVIGGEDEENLRRFKRRLPVYNTADKVQVRLNDLLESHTLVLEKISIEAKPLGRGVFANDSIL